MQRDNNAQEELQRNIAEQEQAMSALLVRVMERPFTPLHKSIEELRTQVAAVQQASVHAAQTTEAGLSELMESQGKRLSRHVNDVLEGVDGLKDALARLSTTLEKHHGEIDAKADAANGALVKVENAIGAVREQQHAAAERTRADLDGLVERLALQQTHFDAGLGKTAEELGKLDHKVTSTADGIAVAARIVAKVDADLGTLREQEQEHAVELNGGLGTLVQQLDRHHTGLAERIETVKPALVPHFDALGATVDKSSKEIVQRHDALAQTQQALLTATVQEQLALQLAPFQARTKWLAVMCALSFASTLALLGMQFIH
jgi:hypothetical protein